MKIFAEFGNQFLLTIIDVAAVVILITVFQVAILRKPIPHIKNVIFGVILVIIGLTFFLLGLEKALFPVGNIMAKQLSSAEFVGVTNDTAHWLDYYWIYIFAGFIGFATTIAEPALIAVAMKAHEVSGGTIHKLGLRLAVAFGASFALVLGTVRIVIGAPLYLFIIVGYVIVIILTIITPKKLIALAYDSGGVTTSTVTVPIVTALGLGLAGAIPGRNPALDGFGMIALTCLFPIISVMTYAKFQEWKLNRVKESNPHKEEENNQTLIP